jgi:hypothetical protein
MRTLCGLCVLAKPLGVLSRHPCRIPKPLPRGEGLCMLGWLCIVQSLLAYTPGIRAGAILMGLPPLNPVGGYAPATPFSENTKVYRQTETPFRGCFRLFYNLLRAVKISPYFLYFFTFFMDKTCFCSVLYKKSSPPYCFAFTKGALL